MLSAKLTAAAPVKTFVEVNMVEDMKEERKHEVDWEDHLAAGLKGLRRELKGDMKEFPTKEFRMHTRAARREMLLALRSLVDRAIERTEEKPEEPKASRVVIE
jgi:hypothetical protein